MKGLIFIFAVYLTVIIISGLIKFLYVKYFKRKKVEVSPSTPKIYYIKNGTQPKKPQKMDIAIKGRIIDKEN